MILAKSHGLEWTVQLENVKTPMELTFIDDRDLVCTTIWYEPKEPVNGYYHLDDKWYWCNKTHRLEMKR